MDPGRLAISVSHPDGHTTRWAYDEVDAGLIPNDLRFDDTTPGGFATCGWSGFRGLDPRPDERLFSTITVYGPGGQVAWQGRVAQLPRQTDGGYRVVPGGVGWSAHLMDDETFMEVYVHRGTDGWAEASLTRRAALATAGWTVNAIEMQIGNGGITWTPTKGQIHQTDQATEAVYTAPPGVQITVLQRIGYDLGTLSFFDPEAWFTSNNPDLVGAATGAMTYANTSFAVTPGRYVMMRLSNAVSWTQSAPGERGISKIALFGDHGLTRRTIGVGEPDGLYASDIIGHVLTEAAPLINHGPDTIQPTTFAIPHLSYPAPTNAANVIADANAYHNWDWLVWEGPTFYYQPNGSGTEWQARIGDGASLSLEGDTGEQIINGVIVAYRDGQTTRYAGPPGSGMDIESAVLQDTDAENPASAAGIAKKWALLPINFPTTDAGAIELGYLYLVERNLAATGGTMNLTGQVRHPTEGMVPVWRIRSGDTIRLTDRPGDPPRRIVQKSYSHPSRSVSLSLGSTPNKVETIFQRLTGYTNLVT